MIENVIDWLPNDYSLPKDWKVGRVKDLADYQSGKYIDANEIDEEGIYDVYGGNGLRGKTFNYNHNGQYILIGRQGALCGNINIASGMFWATEHAIVVYKKIKYSLKWIAHIFNVMNFNQYSISAAQPGLAIDRIKRLKLPVPPLSEQQAIANYLYAKTQAIDKKVSLLEQKIETYKKLKRTLINQTITKGLDKNVPLKDSGISWIGQIPQHWEVKRFKSFADTIKGKNLEVFDNQIEGALPNLSLEYLRNDSVGFEAFVKTNNRNLIVDENDLIIVWDGAGVGEILNGKVGVISSTIAKLKFNKSVNAKFFSFIRYDLEYRLKQIPTGMGIPHLNPHELKNFMCPIPPKSEQEEIANYLDNKTATIDAIVSNMGKQIDTLKQLRKTVINDVVTGKIKVVE